ncbi:hypothetical protein Chor_012545 [Crotalus horridus]
METVELLQAKVNSLDVATLDQVEARLQVHQLYALVQEWSPLASTLPEVVQRLVAVRQLHEQAMQFGQLLTHLDTTQQMIANSLKDNVTLLTQEWLLNIRDISTTLKHLGFQMVDNLNLVLLRLSLYMAVQKAMKENLAAVEDNFANINSRVQKLAK